jgi:DNA-binding Lrp family transcriptional regulator
MDNNLKKTIGLEENNYNICIYYDEKKETIIDILPKNIDSEKKNAIEILWNQHIAKKILILLSQYNEMTIPKIKDTIGHSMSTLHEMIGKLEAEKLIKSEMIYTKNKQRIITSNILCITRNPKHTEKIKRFFQGLWIDSKKTKKIVDFLNNNPQKYYTIEDISLETKIPVDDVELLLSNWDSLTTRGIKGLLKEAPFEKKVLYKGKS